jgi:FixJ family two-component response regulator
VEVAVLNTTPVVFVLDSDPTMRAATESLIRGIGFHAECFARAAEFFARPRPAEPACLLLEMSLPDLHGLEVQAQLGAGGGELPVIFNTDCQDIPTAVKAMKGGAFGFFAKPVPPEVLLDSICHAIESSRDAIRRRVEIDMLCERFGSLSPREREVMELVASGCLNKQVGGELGISEVTVKAHRGRVMRKMQAQSFAQLVTMRGALAATVRLGGELAW